MQQRQLRLGDILDDYCPRERRLANHTIVAMVGDEIRLTRCTTCDTEHPYKGGKMPRLRKKKVANEAAPQINEPSAAVATPAEPNAPNLPVVEEAIRTEAAAANPNGDAPAAGASDEVRLHRPLIRAQLPRIERESAARPVPEFTIHQAKRQGRFQTRPGRFTKGGGPAHRQGNARGPSGPHGARQGGRPQGHSTPMRPQHGRPGQHKKRSR
jgi:hypothetical protein